MGAKTTNGVDKKQSSIYNTHVPSTWCCLYGTRSPAFIHFSEKSITYCTAEERLYMYTEVGEEKALSRARNRAPPKYRSPLSYHHTPSLSKLQFSIFVFCFLFHPVSYNSSHTVVRGIFYFILYQVLVQVRVYILTVGWATVIPVSYYYGGP